VPPSRAAAPEPHPGDLQGRCEPDHAAAKPAECLRKRELRHLDVRGTAPASAVVRLEEAYHAWAAQHPCTPAADGGSGTRNQPDAGVASTPPSSGGCQGTAARTNGSGSGLAVLLVFVLLVTGAVRHRRRTQGRRGG